MRGCFFVLAAVGPIALAMGSPPDRKEGEPRSAALSGPWEDGWDRPVDEKGDCRFDQEGDRLTVTVPREGHEIDTANGRMQGPRLLRVVEGDFSVQVRTGGAFLPTGKSGQHRAGLFVTDGTTSVKFQRNEAPKDAPESEQAPLLCEVGRLEEFGLTLHEYETPTGKPALPLDKPGYLRLERRGDTVAAAYSENGVDWIPMQEHWKSWDKVGLKRRVRVGVAAESTGAGSFAPWFDKFELTHPR